MLPMSRKNPILKINSIMMGVFRQRFFAVQLWDVKFVPYMPQFIKRA
jgi:hypothetical protein